MMQVSFGGGSNGDAATDSAMQVISFGGGSNGAAAAK